MFGVYDGVKRPSIEQYGMNEYSAKCLGGMVAGTFEALLMPFERIQTILADSAYHERYNNTSHAFRMIIREHGAKELYRGLIPILIRNGPSNAVFFVLREEAAKHQHNKVISFNLYYYKFFNIIFIKFSARSYLYQRLSIPFRSGHRRIH
jgi:hypothetical protein